jgi:hypothetical protein
MSSPIIILNEAFHTTPHSSIAEIYKKYPYADIHKNRIPSKRNAKKQYYLHCPAIGTVIKCEEPYSFKLDHFLPSPVIYHVIAYNTKTDLANKKIANPELIEQILGYLGGATRSPKTP